MFVIGVTGGIASGKSALTEYLAPQAAAVIDADEIARQVLAPGTAAHGSVLARFGPEILDERGMIDRRELGRLVFADKANVDFINKATHPEIIKIIRARLKYLGAGPADGKIVVLRAPLLIEAGLAGEADMVVVVVAGEETRIRRLMENRGMTRDEALRIIAAQATDEERIRRADIVVRNDGDWESLADEARRVLAEAESRRRRSG